MTGQRAGFWLSWLLAAGGVIAIAIHSIFLLNGSPAFRSPVSLLVLALLLPSSVVLLIATLKNSRTRLRV